MCSGPEAGISRANEGGKCSGEEPEERAQSLQSPQSLEGWPSSQEAGLWLVGISGSWKGGWRGLSGCGEATLVVQAQGHSGAGGEEEGGGAGQLPPQPLPGGLGPFPGACGSGHAQSTLTPRR